MTRSRATRLVAVLAVAASLATACGGGGEDPLSIGFRRVALDLAFKDAEKAPPVDPPTIIKQFVDSETRYTIEEVAPEPRDPTVIRRVRVVPRRVVRDCPTAPEGLAPERVTFPVVKSEPKVGTYPRHNAGTMNIALATSNTELPVPPLSTWTIPSVEIVRGQVAVAPRDLDTLNPPAAVTENDTAFVDMPQFSVTRRLLPGYSTTDTYRYTYTDVRGGDFLYLVKRVTVARGVESVFEPSPPIRVMRLGVTEGDAVDAGTVHGGVDRTTNVAMTIESQILSRELVDVCGEIVDTYRVQIKERVVNLNTGDISGNEGDTANFWNIQIDNGLLVVREEVNSTVRTTTEIAGAPVPVVITYAYTSTLDTLEPKPLDASTATPPAGASGEVDAEAEE
jgi:hypothetical protein